MSNEVNLWIWNKRVCSCIDQTYINHPVQYRAPHHRIPGNLKSPTPHVPSKFGIAESFILTETPHFFFQNLTKNTKNTKNKT